MQKHHQWLLHRRFQKYTLGHLSLQAHWLSYIIEMTLLLSVKVGLLVALK